MPLQNRPMPCAIIIGIAIIAIAALYAITTYVAPEHQHDSLYEDEARIASGDLNYSYRNQQGNVNGENSPTHISMSFGSFTGGDELWQLTARKSASMTVTMKADISRGDWKLALVDSTSDVKTLLEGSGSEEFRLTLPEGENRLVSLGRKGASGSVDITLDSFQNITAKPSFFYEPNSNWPF